MRARLLLVVLVAAGCGGAHHRQPVTSTDGKAVFRDVYDGRLDHDWSCGSLRAAVRRLPPDPPVYSKLPGIIGAAAARACDDELSHLAAGATRSEVRSALGMPTAGERCWRFEWPSDKSSPVDGARICFSGERADTIQTAVHG